LSSVPDPSQPDQFEKRVQEMIEKRLNDPLSYPDAMTNWLATFVVLNTPDPPKPPA